MSKLTVTEGKNNNYIIQKDDWAYGQRRGLDSATESPLREHEEVIIDLCAELLKLQIERDDLQFKLDNLMLEYCPEEMADEQVKEWGDNQKPSEEKDNEQ